jgi:hypothetical protein
MRSDVDLENIPLPPSPDPDNVRTCAMLIGELMYVAVNTVPTIAYAVSCLARYMTKATPQHYEYAYQVLRYLKDVKHRLGVLAKFDIRLNEASFHLMLTLHGQMTNLQSLMNFQLKSKCSL